MRNRKSGVAVIIVLGLLALLMVLGVAFSVSMRVERTGAANYASAVKTRQMVWAGLARAIGDINRSTTGLAPDGDFLTSRNATPVWGSNTVTGVRLLTGSVTNYVPSLLLDLGYGNKRSEWLALTGGDDWEGYAAYMVLNLSDMLDLNYVGGAVREGGTNVAELVLDSIGVDGVALATARDNDGPFESLADFKALYPEISSHALCAYSRYLPDNNRTNAIYIGGTATELLANELQIRDRFRTVVSAGRPTISFRPQDWPFLFGCLLDYIGTNTVPTFLEGPSANRVPMLNEVVVQPRIQIRGNNQPGRIQIQTQVETWYPFFQPISAPFQVLASLSATVTVISLDGTNTTTSTNQMISAAYTPQTNEYHVSTPAVPWQFDFADSTNSPQYSVNIQVRNLRVVTGGTSTAVDSATNVVLSFVYNGSTPPPTPVMTPVSCQISDPRINWRQSDWHSMTNTTIGSPNIAGNYRMLHSGKGRLASPLELGFLVYPERDSSNAAVDPWIPWRTFNVFDGSGTRHKLLENFTSDSISNAVRRGLMNPNSLNADIVETAFRGMPNPYIGASALDAATLTAVQDLFYEAQTNGTVFSSLTDVLDLDWQSALPTLSDVEREAIAAYSTGLMGVRQNLFLIVVSASAASEGMGESNRGQVGWRGRQRALAVVWRDPVANAQGLHDCFVRLFKWLD